MNFPASFYAVRCFYGITVAQATIWIRFFSLSLLSLLRSRVNLIFLVWSVQSIIFIDFRRVLVPNPAIAIKKMNSHLKDLPCSRLWWSSLESAKKSQSTGICMNFLSHSAALHPSTWQSTLEESFALMQMHTHSQFTLIYDEFIQISHDFCDLRVVNMSVWARKMDFRFVRMPL